MEASLTRRALAELVGTMFSSDTAHDLRDLIVAHHEDGLGGSVRVDGSDEGAIS